MMLKRGLILFVLCNLIVAMPMPLDERSTSTVSTDIVPPDLLKVCYEQNQCHCIKGIAICHNNRCHCLFSTSVDSFENSPTNGTDAGNDTQQSDTPL